MLSFKILISKIFGFNHESSLANFSIWLNSALTGIHSICFEIFFVENLAILSEPIQITTNFINNYDLSKEVTDFFDQNKLDCTEDNFKIIAKYLVTFTKHFSEFYFDLYKSSHGLDNDDFLNFMADFSVPNDHDLFNY